MLLGGAMWCSWKIVTYDYEAEFEKECIQAAEDTGSDPCIHGRFDCFCYLGGPPKTPASPFSHFSSEPEFLLEDCASECSDEFLAE
jgi:hypothetical protein